LSQTARVKTGMCCGLLAARAHRHRLTAATRPSVYACPWMHRPSLGDTTIILEPTILSSICLLTYWLTTVILDDMKKMRSWRISADLAQYVTEADMMARKIVANRFPSARGRGHGKFAALIVDECLRRSLADVVREIKDAHSPADVAFLVR
jgi:hypothetical protein